MTGNMVTLVAYGTDDKGEQRTATLTASGAAFDRDPGQHKKIVRAWFAEDNPDVPAERVKLEIHRG